MMSILDNTAMYFDTTYGSAVRVEEAPAYVSHEVEVGNEIGDIDSKRSTQNPGFSNLDDVIIGFNYQTSEIAIARTDIIDEGAVSNRILDGCSENEELFHLKPRRQVKDTDTKALSEEYTSTKYYEKRRKNTEAAQKCRNKKRILDQHRVDKIKTQLQRIKQLEEELTILRNEKRIYQNIIADWGKHKTQLP